MYRHSEPYKVIISPPTLSEKIMKNKEITELFEKWNNALQTGNPEVVASL